MKPSFRSDQTPSRTITRDVLRSDSNLNLNASNSIFFQAGGAHLEKGLKKDLTLEFISA
jgi:hypothetical protein